MVSLTALRRGRLLDLLLQLAVLVHLDHDVAAAEELAVDVELRIVGQFEDVLTPSRIDWSESTSNVSKSAAGSIEDHHGGGEAALRNILRPS